MTPHPAVAQTQRWLEDVVIGLDLCPFAARPYAAKNVVYQVCEAAETAGIYQRFLEFLAQFLQADAAQQETVLILVPQGLGAFPRYLEMLSILEDALAEADLAGVVQIASFHPDYCFAGAGSDDPANYTNRSPVPMFHLLREAALSDALARFPNPEQIPIRNVRRLRALGLARVRALLVAACNG